MSKLDDILRDKKFRTLYSQHHDTDVRVELTESSVKEAKQQIKDLMLELINEAYDAPSTNKLQILRNKVEEL